MPEGTTGDSRSTHHTKVAHGFLKNTFDTNPEPIEFESFLDLVRNETFQTEIDDIRNFIMERTALGETIEQYRPQLAKMKQKLPGCIPGLLYTGERTHGDLSRIMCVDYDGVENAPALIEQMRSLPGGDYLLAAYISVSSKGVAAFYRYDVAEIEFINKADKTPDGFGCTTGTPLHQFRHAPKASLGSIMEVMEANMLIPPGVDAAVKDFPRLRFVSTDPNLFYNPSANYLGVKITVENAVPPRCRVPVVTFTVSLQSE